MPQMTKVNKRKPANWYLCFWNAIAPKFVNILISCAAILPVDTSPTNMLLVPLFDKITIKFYVGFLGTVNSHLPFHTGIQLRRDQFSLTVPRKPTDYFLEILQITSSIPKRVLFTLIPPGREWIVWICWLMVDTRRCRVKPLNWLYGKMSAR